MSSPESHSSIDRLLQEGEVSVGNPQGKAERTKRHPLPLKTISALAIATGLVVVGGSSVGAVLNGDIVKTETKAHIDEPAKAEAVKIETDMNLIPIPVALSEFDVTNLNVSMTDTTKVNLFEVIKFEFPSGKIEGEFEGNAEASFNILPGKATLRYNSDEDVLYIDAPQTGLTVDVQGDVTQVDSSRLGTAWMNEHKKVILEGMQSAYDEAFQQDASDNLSIARQMIKDEISIEEGFREFAKLYLLTQVDQKCTPLITQIPEFIEQVEDNILTVVQGRILDLDEQNNVLLTMLSNPNIADLSDEEKVIHVKKVIENAVVEIPQDLNGYKVQPDQEKAADLKAYTDTEIFSAALQDEEGNDISIECTIPDDIRVDIEEGGN